MKNILISLLVFVGGLFFLASNVQATTYYVDTETGQNGNSGTTSGSPLLDLEYATQLLSAGDTIEIVAPKTDPSRSILSTSVDGTSANNITFQGTSASNRANITSGKNLSNGDAIGNLIKNGNLEGWVDSSTIWAITSVSGIGSGSLTKETTTARDQASAKIVRSGTSIYLRWNVNNLPASTEYTFSYWHQEADPFIRPKFSIAEDLATDNYLQADDSWAAGVYTIDPNDNSVGTWVQTTKTFTTNGAGDYFFTISLTNNSTFYLDDISLVPTTNSYQWGVYSGDVYSIDGYVEDPRTFAKATTSDWNTNGVTALSYAPQAASLAAIAAGEWWYESGTLYYYLDTGETIGGLHIETGTGTGVHGITFSNDYYNWNNINQYMGNQYGMYITGDNVTINNSSFYLDGVMGLNSGGVNVVANSASGSYTYSEDIFEVSAGDFTCNKCLAEYSFDDGFQAITTGDMTVNYSISRFNGLENASDNSGFAVESDTAKMYIYNSLSYNNYGRGIQVGANSAYEVINNISWGSTGDAEAWMNSSYESNGTHTHNIFEAKNLAWTTDSTEQLNADPKFVDASNGDYSLLSTSPAIDAGTDVSLTSDYIGTSVPQGSAPDIGPYEYIFPATAQSQTVALTVASPPTCSDQAPSTAPWLYNATATSRNSIKISFTKAGNPIDYYALEYGTESGVYKYSSTNIGGAGITTYLVNYLQPNTLYYLRIRGGNGCATGPWSTEISARTLGSRTANNTTDDKPAANNHLEIVDTKLTPSEEKDTEKKVEGYNISVEVIDTNNNPVEGAKVTIHSKVQETITDKNGVATFSNVEPGEHKVLIAYDGYSGEQAINLSGDSKEYKLNITVEKKNNFASPQALILIGGLMFIIAVLLVPFLRFRSRKTA